MNFRYKNALQHVFSALPKGETLNYFFQRYVTKRLPISDDEFLQKLRFAKRHANHFRRFDETGTAHPGHYEFGAGWDMVNPIVLSLLGFTEQKCIDIRKLIHAELVRDTMDRLEKHCPEMASALPKDRPEQRTVIPFLKNRFGIDYRAPLDARHTGFASSSVDFISSTMTYEHIPEQEIPALLNECHRILRPGGLMSLAIDYEDHWFYFDKSLSPYHFLQYSDAAWKKYNPALHFQNRLRHRDYRHLIRQAGFDILSEDTFYPVIDLEIDTLRKMQVDSRFSGYSFDELAIKNSWLVVRKPR